MVKLQLLFTVIVFVVWVYTLVNVAMTPSAAVRTLPKVAWVVLVLIFPILGTAGWFIFGRPNAASLRRSAYERATPEFPEYDRPGRAAAVDPEKDAEFLRQIRAKAEEQRRRYEQAKKQQAEKQQAEPKPDPEPEPEA